MARVAALGRDFDFGCLRSLREDDATLMLEWMHDGAIAGLFAYDFSSMGIDDALEFIQGSWSCAGSLHFAIDDGNGEYLGTVSLKGIDERNGSAEYAISTRHCAHGSGAAMRATRDVLDFAFGEVGLHRVYLDVRADNARAIRFYEKVGFAQEGIARKALRLPGPDPQGYVDLIWLAMLRDEWEAIR